MDEKHISKYEAATMYAHENTTAQTEVTEERKYLILDLEQCSAGFCTCGQKETKLIHNWDTSQTEGDSKLVEEINYVLPVKYILENVVI